MLEAMSAEKPTIASNIGGMKEVINNGTNGILIEPGDWKGLGEAIINITKDKLLAKRIATSGYQTVSKKYDWKIIAKEFLEDFNENTVS